MRPDQRRKSRRIYSAAEGWAIEQFVASLFLVFAALALALAATGLYSVVSYATALRIREFGIRVALGAQRRHVMGLVLSSAAKTVGVGIGAGLALCAASNSLLARWVAGSVYDPVMLGAVILTLGVVGAVAAFLPARRAAGRDPVRALRSE
jgi:ABC-type antimicrobial peptide transport system permease subunit